jgi:hypothetical protein
MKVALWCWVTGNMVPEPGRRMSLAESVEYLGCEKVKRKLPCGGCILIRAGEPTPELAPSYHEWIEAG